MPTYLYECEECGRFEKFQKITDDPLKKCPKCEGKVKKIIGSPGIIFKGSGFYSTDNDDSPTVKNGSSVSSDETPKKTEKTAKKKDDKKVS